MNVVLWILQILLALHTVAGSVWKLSNSEQTVPSLATIPHGVWLGMAAFEILLALGLILPAFNKRLAILAPVAAACIAAEKLLFTWVAYSSGAMDHGEVTYWLVLAAVCAFTAYGRLALKPPSRAGRSRDPSSSAMRSWASE